MTNKPSSILMHLSDNYETQRYCKTASQDSGLSRKRKFLTIVSHIPQERDIKTIAELKNKAIGRKDSCNLVEQKGINLKIRRGSHHEPLT